MDAFTLARLEMVAQQLRRNGIRDERLLHAMETVPRERFVPPEQVPFACDDRALPIGSGQTISQPWVVAVMLEQLELQPDDNVLEVGSGSGYVLVLLSKLAGRVCGIEHHHALCAETQARLEALGIDVALRHGDGMLGWPERAPFDAIVVSAGAGDVPPALLEQLAVGGRLVIPLGRSSESQRLIAIERRPDDSFRRRTLFPVRFVPLVPGVD